MKNVLYSLMALSTFIPVFGLDVHRSLHLNLNTPDRKDAHLKLEHQYTFVSDKDDVVLFNASYKPFLGYFHNIETGFGYRKFNEKLGFGINLFYSTNNKAGFFAHRFNPGLEFFFDNFQISINHSVPLKKDLVLKRMNYNFPAISEIGLTYRPSKKYEFGIIPNYNHSSRKWGVDGRVSAFVSNSIELGVTPFYRPERKGISFSIGYTFGGPKERKAQSIRKSGYHPYMGNKIENKVVFLPAPVIEAIPQIQEPVVETTVVPPPEVPPSTGWSDFFFTGPKG